MWSALLLSLLSGVLLTVGFPAVQVFYVSWVALIPLFLALRNKTGKEAFLLGFACGMAHFTTTLYWIRYVIYHYGGLSLPLAILVLLLLCSYLAVYLACFALFAQRWEKRPVLWVFGLPGAWVTLEWIRAHAVTGFPWASLGYTQTPFTSLMQLADVTGVFGVSWLIVLANTVLVGCFSHRRVRLAGLSVFAVCILGTLFYGSWRLDAIRHLEDQAQPLSVAVIQGNVDQSLKWDKAFQQETLRRYREFSLAAAHHNPRPDLVVWPETSVPFFYGIEEELTSQLNVTLQEIGEPVLFGSPAVTVVNDKPRLQNRAYLVDDKGKLVGGYAKQHLVPFGEYVPLQKVLFFVSKLVEAAGDFVPGRDSTPITLNGQRFGVLICYEGIFPELSRRAVREGATSLINITNDAWYGRTSAPYQHMEMARWRAVEFRVPLIRAANTGISTIVDSTGSICGTIPLDESGQMVCTVRPFHLLTFYAKWGDLFAWICVLMTVGAIFLDRINRTERTNGA